MKNMKLAGSEQVWLVLWIIRNGPWHCCLRVWHFRATRSRACHTDNIPWGEAVNRNTDFIYLFFINPTQWRYWLHMEIVCLGYLVFASLSYHNVTPCVISAAVLCGVFAFPCWCPTLHVGMLWWFTLSRLCISLAYTELKLMRPNETVL